MKRYILTVMTAMLALAGCQTQHGKLFDSSVSGVYFKPLSSNQYYWTRNFANYVDVDTRDTLSVTISIKAMGHIDALRDRIAIVTARPYVDEDTGEEYELSNLIFDDRVVIPAGGVEGSFLLSAVKPALEHKTAAVLCFDLSNPYMEFGEGISEHSEFLIRSDYSYDQPEEWPAVEQYYGEHSPEKYKFLLRLFKGDATFFTSNYSKSQGENNWEAVKEARSLAQAKQVTGDQSIYVPDIPFVVRTYYGRVVKAYDKPYYWNDTHTEWCGDWFIDNAAADSEESYYDRHFAHFAKWKGLTTEDERRFFLLPADSLHRNVIKCMMETYNDYFRHPEEFFQPTYGVQGGQPRNNYEDAGRFMCRHLLADFDYDNDGYEVAPAQWVDPKAAPLVEKYYGAYSWKKLCFIIKNLLPEYPACAYYPRIFCVSSAYFEANGNSVAAISYTKWPETSVSDGEGNKDDNNNNKDVAYHDEEAQLKEYSVFLYDKAIAAGFADWPDWRNK